MKFLKSIILAILLLLSFVMPTNAARYYMGADTTNFSSEGFFQIDVYLDSQSEVINAFEGDVVLPFDLVNIVDIRTGGSFVSFWVQPPAQTSTSTVHFAGIFPGGFTGNNAYLFSVLGQVKDYSSRQTAASPFLGRVTMQNMNVLLHDGLGSPADTTFSPFDFSISRAAVTADDNREVLQANDEEPPELFDPIITQDENLYEGQVTLVFATQDKGVGVSHYEVYESDEVYNEENPAEAIQDWKRVESPYVLQDQTRSKFVYVKAVDKVGNERIVLVPAKHPMGDYSIKAIWGIIGTVLIVLAVLGLVLWHHRMPQPVQKAVPSKKGNTKRKTKKK